MMLNICHFSCLLISYLSGVSRLTSSKLYRWPFIVVLATVLAGTKCQAIMQVSDLQRNVGRTSRQQATHCVHVTSSEFIQSDVLMNKTIWIFVWEVTCQFLIDLVVHNAVIFLFYVITLYNITNIIIILPSVKSWENWSQRENKIINDKLWRGPLKQLFRCHKAISQ